MPTPNRQVLGQVFPIRGSPSLVQTSASMWVHQNAVLAPQADTPKLAAL